jgi:hypothetical protein
MITESFKTFLQRPEAAFLNVQPKVRSCEPRGRKRAEDRRYCDAFNRILGDEMKGIQRNRVGLAFDDVVQASPSFWPMDGDAGDSNLILSRVSCDHRRLGASNGPADEGTITNRRIR